MIEYFPLEYSGTGKVHNFLPWQYEAHNGHYQTSNGDITANQTCYGDVILCRHVVVGETMHIEQNSKVCQVVTQAYHKCLVIFNEHFRSTASFVRPVPSCFVI